MNKESVCADNLECDINFKCKEKTTDEESQTNKNSSISQTTQASSSITTKASSNNNTSFGNNINVSGDVRSSYGRNRRGGRGADGRSPGVTTIGGGSVTTTITPDVTGLFNDPETAQGAKAAAEGGDDTSKGTGISSPSLTIKKITTDGGEEKYVIDTVNELEEVDIKFPFPIDSLCDPNLSLKIKKALKLSQHSTIELESVQVGDTSLEDWKNQNCANTFINYRKESFQNELELIDIKIKIISKEKDKVKKNIELDKFIKKIYNNDLVIDNYITKPKNISYSYKFKNTDKIITQVIEIKKDIEEIKKDNDEKLKKLLLVIFVIAVILIIFMNDISLY